MDPYSDSAYHPSPLRTSRRPRVRSFLLAVAVAAAALWIEQGSASAQSLFIRADSNDDGQVNVADVTCTLLYLFTSGDGVCHLATCLDARDSNDDDRVDISDALYLLEALFSSGNRGVPPPFPDCGLDPTPDDSLGCELSRACETSGGITFRIGPDTELFSIWSEGYDTAPEQHAVLSVIRFAGGSHRIFERRDTEDVHLIESLRFGPDLAPATPLGAGSVSYDGEQRYPYSYRQSFRVSLGEWTFRLSFRRKTGDVDFDCRLLDGDSFETDVLYLAELEVGEEKRNVHYSCFSPEVWVPTRDPLMPAKSATPRRLTLDDGTKVELETEDAYLYRGIAGETANRRLSGAAVEIGGERVEVTAHEHLVYAGLHHNSQQEFRVLFEAPRGAIHGIDVVDCPPGVGPPFFCYLPTPGESKAYYLDGSLERTTELTVTAAVIGE